MHRPQESFVTIPAKAVKMACIQYLDYRQDKMHLVCEPNILKKMKGGWLSKSMTREQAIENLYGTTWDDYSLVRYCNDFDSNRVFDLKNLAEVASIGGGNMHVSCSDASILQNYLKLADHPVETEISM